MITEKKMTELWPQAPLPDLTALTRRIEAVEEKVPAIEAQVEELAVRPRLTIPTPAPGWRVQEPQEGGPWGITLTNTGGTWTADFENCYLSRDGVLIPCIPPSSHTLTADPGDYEVLGVKVALDGTSSLTLSKTGNLLYPTTDVADINGVMESGYTRFPLFTLRNIGDSASAPYFVVTHDWRYWMGAGAPGPQLFTLKYEDSTVKCYVPGLVESMWYVTRNGVPVSPFAIGAPWLSLGPIAETPLYIIMTVGPGDDGRWPTNTPGSAVFTLSMTATVSQQPKDSTVVIGLVGTTGIITQLRTGVIDTYYTQGDGDVKDSSSEPSPWYRSLSRTDLGNETLGLYRFSNPIDLGTLDEELDSFPIRYGDRGTNITDLRYMTWGSLKGIIEGLFGDGFSGLITEYMGSYPCDPEHPHEVWVWDPCGEGDWASMSFWRSGGDEATCFGTAIGNGDGTVVVDLAAETLLTGSETALDWGARVLLDWYGADSADWGDRALYGIDGVLSVDWARRSLHDYYGVPSLEWETRNLFNSAGEMVAAWGAVPTTEGTESLSAAYGFRAGEYLKAPVIYLTDAHPLHLGADTYAPLEITVVTAIDGSDGTPTFSTLTVLAKE